MADHIKSILTAQIKDAHLIGLNQKTKESM